MVNYYNKSIKTPERRGQSVSLTLFLILYLPLHYRSTITMFLFGEKRKTEPKSIFRCRVFIMIIILSLLAAYTTFLIFEIVKDTPVVTTKLETTTNMTLPTVFIAFQYNYTLTCVFQYKSMCVPMCILFEICAIVIIIF